jgi:hypothetical protein
MRELQGLKPMTSPRLNVAIETATYKAPGIGRIRYEMIEVRPEE